MRLKCKVKGCRQLAEVKCTAHGCFCKECGSESHQECGIKQIPSVETVKEELDSIKALIMTIRDDTRFLEVDESFLINHSDLPLLEEELQTLIAELSKILSNKSVSLLVEMHERLNELKMKVYNSMIFKIV